jgi:hypothetical protein
MPSASPPLGVSRIKTRRDSRTSSDNQRVAQSKRSTVISTAGCEEIRLRGSARHGGSRVAKLLDQRPETKSPSKIESPSDTFRERGLPGSVRAPVAVACNACSSFIAGHMQTVIAG